MMQGLRELWGKIQYNIKRVMDSDPAATSVWMVIWTYPHITALFWHFFAHRLYKAGWPTLARRVALHSRHVTGIEIHPGATIGRGLFIDHGMGVVIGETAIVGDNVTLFHQVTLGGMSSKQIKRHPTIEDEVLIGTGTKILGDITIGARTKSVVILLLNTISRKTWLSLKRIQKICMSVNLVALITVRLRKRKSLMAT